MEARIYDEFDWNVMKALIGGNSVKINIRGDRRSGNISVEAAVLDPTGLKLKFIRKEVDLGDFETIAGYYSLVMPVIEEVAQSVMKRKTDEEEEGQE